MILTAGERALLRLTHRTLGQAIATPDAAIASYRLSEGGGFGPGYRYTFTRTAIAGGPTGTDSTITYDRIRRWVLDLPADVRAQALTWWRTYPENTRDLDKLDRLVLDQLADPEPADLLDLLEMTA